MMLNFLDASEIGTEIDMKIPDSIRCHDPSYRAPLKKEPVQEEVADDDYEVTFCLVIGCTILLA